MDGGTRSLASISSDGVVGGVASVATADSGGSSGGAAESPLLSDETMIGGSSPPS